MYILAYNCRREGRKMNGRGKSKPDPGSDNRDPSAAGEKAGDAPEAFSTESPDQQHGPFCECIYCLGT
ncbi:protein of unknown function [Kyrpidia spormannii]|uniref:Uncharacterized protein n=1 Tax=Kyrpidia spormannii TaxID=2055160 RepID=A0A6F9ED95_9BACL|nr:protein of unknown function [Kyrpidia spormannii]